MLLLDLLLLGGRALAPLLERAEELELGDCMEMAMEDWCLDLERKSLHNHRTPWMSAQERRGVEPFQPKPDDIDAVSFGGFFDSLFELADSSVGCRLGESDEEAYASYLHDLLQQMVNKQIDAGGRVWYSWRKASNALVGGEGEWPEVLHAEEEIVKHTHLEIISLVRIPRRDKLRIQLNPLAKTKSINRATSQSLGRCRDRLTLTLKLKFTEMSKYTITYNRSSKKT